MNLKKSLDEWAVNLKQKAMQAATSLQESTDAFKAVTAYYAAQQKGRKKSVEDDETDASGFSFADEGAHGGNGQKVPARRNS